MSLSCLEVLYKLHYINEQKTWIPGISRHLQNSCSDRKHSPSWGVLGTTALYNLLQTEHIWVNCSAPWNSSHKSRKTEVYILCINKKKKYWLSLSVSLGYTVLLELEETLHIMTECGIKSELVHTLQVNGHLKICKHHSCYYHQIKYVRNIQSA